VVKQFWWEGVLEAGFSWGKVNVILASPEQCSQLQQSCWCRYWLFAAFTTSVTHNRLDNSQNSLFPLGDQKPHCSLDSLELPTQWHLDRFSHFCRVHERNQQTDRHTDRPHYSVCSNRPHLAIAAMRPKNMTRNKRIRVSITSEKREVNWHKGKTCSVLNSPFRRSVLQ